MTLTMADMASGSESSREPGAGSRAGQAVRRTFSAAYKLAMVAEYDAATAPGARGALLRREGLYQSHISKWRTARDQGSLTRKEKKPAPDTGSSPSRVTGESAQTRKLRAENERLTAELEKTRAVVEILGKTHALLEMLSESADQPPKPTA